MLTSHLQETRFFKPPQTFSDAAQITGTEYEAIKQQASKKPLKFWEQQAKRLVWQKPFTQTLDWQLPFAKWFVGGQLNVTETCLDQHLTTHRRHKAAIIWEGENGDTRTLTYLQLHQKVCGLATTLQQNGIHKGDRVAIYMPLIPEAAVAMLACARIGAIHTVIFGGFSAHSVRDRINDSQCKAVITADGGYRKGGTIELKKTVDEALSDNQCPSIKHVFVYQHTKQPIRMVPERDQWWTSHEYQQHTAEVVTSEHPLFILYTSGTTGKPKGLVHSSAGYLTQAMTTSSMVFDLRDDDLYWCTADVGWITGHSYVVYGPLANGATVFLYEGAPLHPTPSRFWEMIERHRISILYTAPTAIRTFMRCGDEHVIKHDLSSLRLLGSVGEPINPEAWMWYHSTIGKNRCPIVDTWWQTETGGIMISPLPGATTTTPGSATQAFFGIDIDVVRPDGSSCETNEGGYLIVKKPWPSIAIGIWGENQRFTQTYWSQIPGAYFTGDGARKDENGNYWIMGRIDDVVNVSGHRIGTMEIESALVGHAAVAEAAVVARPDTITGQAIVAFVTLKNSSILTPHLRADLATCVAQEIGAFAKPADIRFTQALPKTRSGKIMRRLLRELASTGEVKGDTSTLEDFSVLSACTTE